MLILAGAAGAVCTLRIDSNPGSETTAAFVLAACASLSLIVIHRRHPRDRWIRWAWLELAAIWCGLGLGYDAAQFTLHAEHRQDLLLVSITGTLAAYLLVACSLSVVQLLWPIQPTDE
jgi:hypothetical protein